METPRVPATEPPPYYPPTYTPEPARQAADLAPRGRPGRWRPACCCSSSARSSRALLLLLPKLKLFTTSASMLVSIGAYALIWGWQFGVGLRAAAAGARDGPRAPAAARGHQGQRADVHPLPRRAGGDEGAAQGRRRRGARGPGRPGARDRSARWCRWRSTGSPATSCSRRWPSSASSSTSSTCCRCCRSTAAARWRPSPPRCGWSGFAMLVDAGVRLPEPDHAADPAVRRLRDLAPLEGAQGARGAGVPPRVARGRGGRWRRSTWGWRRCWRSAWTRRSSSATSTTSSGPTARARPAPGRSRAAGPSP